MNPIRYPHFSALPQEVFTPATLQKATAQIFSWRQGAGAFGRLHLHPCWGEASALQRGYHGQTTFQDAALLDGVLRLSASNDDARWKLLADDLAASILYLQTDKGGFFHASSEFEPTYRCEESCPIHQGLPILALLEYLEFPGGNSVRKEAIRTAVDRWLAWLEGYWWMRGNGWKAPLEAPGFCGVTNQDLVIVAVLARHARLTGNTGPWERMGLPTLETYLSSACYHEAIGLFERGDRENFVERSSYYEIIVPMLGVIHGATGDERLPAVADNVTRHLFDALHTGPDHLTHIAWGATTLPGERTRIAGWHEQPYSFAAYPELIRVMGDYLRRNPDPALEARLADLEHTLAAYVFSDGTIPYALGGDPLFAIAGNSLTLWSFLIRRLGENARVNLDEMTVPCVERSLDHVIWRSDADRWSIERQGRRLFAGWKHNPGAVVAGSRSKIAGVDLTPLRQPDIRETLDSAE